MRFIVLTAAMAVTAPGFASGGAWYLDAHRVSPTLEGHYNGSQDGKPVDFDLIKDLALAKDGSGTGFALEYQGPRFGVELSMESQKYAGTNVITRDVTISGQTYSANATLDTNIKLTNYTFNWTIRILKSPGFWLGLDLGARGTSMEVHALGTSYLTGVAQPADFKSGLPMPQLGPSAGFATEDGTFAIRAYYHFLGYKGASYHHAGGDARYFPLKWLGVRAFTSTESWKVPDNSIAKDLEIALDRSGTGFGLIFKF